MHTMTTSKRTTAIEQVAGSLPVEAALTIFAATAMAAAAGPLAPLLPILAKSLAAQRQQGRVEAELVEIQLILAQQEANIRDLSDEQYKIINETVLALLQTTQTEKLRYLRCVVLNALTYRDIDSRESVILSRIVRDISSEEATFLLRAFLNDGILLTAAEEIDEVNPNVLRVSPSSADALSVSGLLSLGLLHPPESGWDGGTMRFTGIVAKLIALLRPQDV